MRGVFRHKPARYESRRNQKSSENPNEQQGVRSELSAAGLWRFERGSVGGNLMLSMSALGQNQTLERFDVISAIAPKGTLRSATEMSAKCQKRTSPSCRSFCRSRNRISGIDSSGGSGFIGSSWVPARRAGWRFSNGYEPDRRKRTN